MTVPHSFAADDGTPGRQGLLEGSPGEDIASLDDQEDEDLQGSGSGAGAAAGTRTGQRSSGTLYRTQLQPAWT